jgi:arylsulfatase A-like enzyme
LAHALILVVLGDNGPPMLHAKVTSFEAGAKVPFIAWWFAAAEEELTRLG